MVVCAVVEVPVCVVEVVAGVVEVVEMVEVVLAKRLMVVFVVRGWNVIVLATTATTIIAATGAPELEPQAASPSPPLPIPRSFAPSLPALTVPIVASAEMVAQDA